MIFTSFLLLFLFFQLVTNGTEKKYNVKVISSDGIYKIFMEDDRIWIVTDKPVTGSRGGEGMQQTRVSVEAKKLEENFTKFLQVIGGVIREAKSNAKDLGEMELDEIELTVEVNGEGQLSLLGNGGKAGGKGAMTLKFKMMGSTIK